MARVVSVNAGLPREVEWRGRIVTTAIFKEPVEVRVPLHRLNLDGDRQADLTVHGGLDKAVYAYPVEHYGFWRDELGSELSWGMFGENLTVEGLPLEDELRIGDRFRVGTAELAVTQPRLPCYKLGIRFGREDMVKRFLRSGRTGYYLTVVEEGEVGAGDRIGLVAHAGEVLSVADVTRLYAFDKHDRGGLRRAVELEALPESWRGYFRAQLAKSASYTRAPRPRR